VEVKTTATPSKAEADVPLPATGSVLTTVVPELDAEKKLRKVAEEQGTGVMTRMMHARPRAQ